MFTVSPRGIGPIAGTARPEVSNSNGLLVKFPTQIRPLWSVTLTFEAKYETMNAQFQALITRQTKGPLQFPAVILPLDVGIARLSIAVLRLTVTANLPDRLIAVRQKRGSLQHRVREPQPRTLILSYGI